ncbi:Uncharacterised protein [Mycobacteroides abscessus subsp. abscessus]|nr:Uncharacterised protein [Mycobacteroides abscessus subsp. abscessus]
MMLSSSVASGASSVWSMRAATSALVGNAVSAMLRSLAHRLRGPARRMRSSAHRT